MGRDQYAQHPSEGHRCQLPPNSLLRILLPNRCDYSRCHVPVDGRSRRSEEERRQSNCTKTGSVDANESAFDSTVVFLVMMVVTPRRIVQLIEVATLLTRVRPHSAMKARLRRESNTVVCTPSDASDIVRLSVVAMSSGVHVDSRRTILE